MKMAKYITKTPRSFNKVVRELETFNDYFNPVNEQEAERIRKEIKEIETDIFLEKVCL